MSVNLSTIVKNRELGPPRVMVYGPHGLGKTTFGAGAPNPIFILTEDGLGLLSVDHFPVAKSEADVINAITSLYEEPHEYQTVIIDSLDWLENLIFADVNNRYDAKDLAFGKGAVIAAERWRFILEGLAALRNDRNMSVVLLAHCTIKRFDSPEVEPYERYQPKLQDRSSALVQEWCDAVLFTNYKTVVTKADVGFNNQVRRGITTGERLLHTTERPAYYAKNRYALPETLPLSWDSFQGAIDQAVAPQPATQVAA
jgi:hypothetical protein